MPVEFLVKIEDFKDALKTLFASTPKGKKAETEYFDFSANDDEMALESQGFSHVSPAEVASPGHARVPYGVMHGLRPLLDMFHEQSLNVLITDGEFKVGTTCIAHPEIKILLIESRKAELPIDAPLPMVLELTTRFSSQELEDRACARGCWRLRQKQRAWSMRQPMLWNHSALHDRLFAHLCGTRSNFNLPRINAQMRILDYNFRILITQSSADLDFQVRGLLVSGGFQSAEKPQTSRARSALQANAQPTVN